MVIHNRRVSISNRALKAGAVPLTHTFGYYQSRNSDAVITVIGQPQQWAGVSAGPMGQPL